MSDFFSWFLVRSSQLPILNESLYQYLHLTKKPLMISFSPRRKRISRIPWLWSKVPRLVAGGQFAGRCGCRSWILMEQKCWKSRWNWRAEWTKLDKATSSFGKKNILVLPLKLDLAPFFPTAGVTELSEHVSFGICGHDVRHKLLELMKSW